MSIFQNSVAKYPKLFALFMFSGGIANGYLAYTHRGSSFWAAFDGFVAILAFVSFLLILLSERTKRRRASRE